jgi:protease I
MKRILMVVAAKDFRDLEYIVPRAIWMQKGAEVSSCSIKPSSIGRFGFKVSHDLFISEVNANDFDAIFFVGGIGSLYFGEHRVAQQITKDFLNQKKPVGAICAATRNFLQWGILNNQPCTGNDWDEKFAEIAEEYNSQYTHTAVVQSGNILTASGPEAVEEAAQTFWSMIQKN